MEKIYFISLEKFCFYIIKFEFKTFQNLNLALSKKI